MGESKTRAGWPIVVCIAAPTILIVALTVYVAGFFVLSEFGTRLNGINERYFNQRWAASIYDPLVRVESYLRGIPVDVEGPPDPSESDPFN